MNERIKELVNQSGWKFILGTRTPMENRDFVVTQEQAEKFAELVVKECVETLRLVPYNSDREFGDEVIYQDAVKKHFGVKE
jgi:hypothetical protein